MSEYKARLILAHGAGAGSDSPFMQQMAALLKARQIEVLLFDFDYMKVIKETGKRRPPEKIEKLEEQYWYQINTQAKDVPLFIGGKSMGGRVASRIYAQSLAQGCVCFGYPFHPPGKPDKLRVEHLQDLDKSLLILQGERDTFGNQNEVAGYELSNAVEICIIKDGDHSFKPRKASGVTLDENMQKAADATVKFIQQQIN